YLDARAVQAAPKEQAAAACMEVRGDEEHALQASLPQIAPELLRLIRCALVVALEDLDRTVGNVQELQNGHTLLVEFQGVNAVALQGPFRGGIVALGQHNPLGPAVAEQ